VHDRHRFQPVSDRLSVAPNSTYERRGGRRTQWLAVRRLVDPAYDLEPEVLTAGGLDFRFKVLGTHTEAAARVPQV
jgi:hypothetical protein